MEAHITANLLRIIFKEKESIIGPMDVNMMVSGKIIRWKAMVCLYGRMVDDMKDCMLMIRKKEMEIFIGQMDVNMKAVGKMVNNMVLVFILLPVGRLSRENGP